MMERKPKALVIDDDPTWLEQVPLVLEDQCEVDAYSTIDQGLEAVESQFYDIVLLDLNFDGDSRTGLDIFRKIHAIDRGTDVIVISGETDHRKLIEIFNAGVSQFVPKMSTPDEIRAAVIHVLEQREYRNRALRQSVSGPAGISLIGDSAEMQKVRAEISRLVERGAKDILLLGETGTGKEVIARTIALQGDPSGRCIVLHCGAVSDGLAESEFFGHVKGAFTGALRDRIGAFEAAAGGFVFLDEIGELPLVQQAKLLRVLQERKVQRVGSHEERKVSFRCIAATHVDLEAAVAKGTFREDLYYRIAKEVVKIPPLRERAEDIPELVQYFLAESPKKQRKTITPDALRLLQSYSWPGNVRQLKAAVESIESRTDGSAIREKDVCQVLPDVASLLSSRATRSLVGAYGTSLIMNERQKYKKAIIQAHGNRAGAAKLLGISRATFFRRAKELGLVHERGEVGTGEGLAF